MFSRSTGNPAPRTISFSRVVNLSHPLDPEMPQWPGDPATEFETVAQREREGYFLRRFATGEHSGTHLNAPLSFYPEGLAVSDLPAERLVAPAVVLAVREQARRDPDYVLTLADLRQWEGRHGAVPPGSILLLDTGWADKWESPSDFLGIDAAGCPHFPGFGAEVVRFLLAERHIAGLGIDTHGVDPGRDESFSINRLVLARPRLVLENLTNLDILPATGATLVIGVLRLRGGSGSPVSVLALVP